MNGHSGKTKHHHGGSHTHQHQQQQSSPSPQPPAAVHWKAKESGQQEIRLSSSPQISLPPTSRRNFSSRRSTGGVGRGCVPGSCSVKIVSLLAILMGIGVMGVCSWVLHRSIQDWRNPTLVTATNLLSQVNTFFGGTTGLYDLDVIYRILTTCSATGFVGGICQFFLSLWLLLAAEGGGRNVARIWVIAHVAIMCSIGGACLCIMTNELQISTPITVFLVVTGANFLLLLPFAWIVFSYSASSRDTYV